MESRRKKPAGGDVVAAANATVEGRLSVGGRLAVGAGLAVGMLTSDDRANALAFLRDAGVEVDVLVCGDDGRGFKPDAEPLLAAAQDLGVPPHSVLMVGDSAHDVGCGAAAGAKTLGVMTGVCSASEMSAADTLLPSVSEMLTDARFKERWLPGLP